MGSIDAIQGLPHRPATKLRKNGIRTTEALLKQAGSRRGRTTLSSKTSLDAADLLRWAHRADLMRVKGIGPEYADLLEVAGVNTIKDLRRRNPGSLSRRMAELSERERLVQRLPTEAMVRKWIQLAGEIEPKVSP